MAAAGPAPAEPERPWRAQLLHYTRRHYYALLHRWSLLHSPLLLDWKTFCAVFLPADVLAEGSASTASPGMRPRWTDRSKRSCRAQALHHGAEDGGPGYPVRGGRGEIESVAATTPGDHGPAPSASSSGMHSPEHTPHRGVSKHGEVASENATNVWPSLLQVNRTLDESGGVGAAEDVDQFCEAAESLKTLAEDVWDAFHVGGGLEALQLLGGLAWLLPSCLRTKARALTRVFDVTRTGHLSCTELSILLDRSLRGLARLVACQAISAVATPYSAALLNQAIAERHVAQEADEGGGSDHGRHLAASRIAGRGDGHQISATETPEAVHAVSNDPVAWEFLVGVLQEIEWCIARCLRPSLAMAETLLLAFPSASLPWIAWLQPGALFLGRFEILRLLHHSSRAPQGRVVLKVQEKKTGVTFALKVVVKRDAHGLMQSGICSPDSGVVSAVVAPALRSSSFLAEARHLQRHAQQAREAGRGHTARCALHGEAPPVAFQLLAWEDGETLQAFLAQRRRDMGVSTPPAWRANVEATADKKHPALASSPSPAGALRPSPEASHLLAPAFSETELVALWLALLSLLQEQHRVGVTHSQLKPSKILLQNAADSLGLLAAASPSHGPSGARPSPHASSAAQSRTDEEAEGGRVQGRAAAEDVKNEDLNSHTGQDVETQGDQSFSEKSLILLDWQLGIEGQQVEKSLSSCLREAHLGSLQFASSRYAYPSSPASQSQAGEVYVHPFGAAPPAPAELCEAPSPALEDEVCALVGHAKRELCRALDAISPEDIEQEIRAFCGAGDSEGYAPPEQQLLALCQAAQAASADRGDASGQGMWNRCDGGSAEVCEGLEGGGGARAARLSPPGGAAPPSLSLRKTWDIYATARIVEECATLHPPVAQRMRPNFWAQFGWRQIHAEEALEVVNCGRFGREARDSEGARGRTVKRRRRRGPWRKKARSVHEESPSDRRVEKGKTMKTQRHGKRRALHPAAQKRFRDVEELREQLEDLAQNLRRLPRALAAAARDCLRLAGASREKPSSAARGAASPAPPAAASCANSEAFSGRPAFAAQQTESAGMDLRRLQFGPFRIRYLAKFARYLNVATLVLPSASASTRAAYGDASAALSSASRDDDVIVIPLGKMLNREERHLDLSGKNLTSLETILITRTLLNASWLEELHLNDNAFGSAPPRGVPSRELLSAGEAFAPSPPQQLRSSSPAEGHSQGQEARSSWGRGSNAAAQLLGVSLTCMRNLKVLNLNRCQLSPVDSLHLLECLRRCSSLRRLLLSSSLMCDSPSAEAGTLSLCTSARASSFTASSRSPCSSFVSLSPSMPLASWQLSSRTRRDRALQQRQSRSSLAALEGPREGSGRGDSGGAGGDEDFENEQVCRLAAKALKYDWPLMEEVDFSLAEISDAGLDLLADAIASHAHLQHVNLSGNPITVVGLRSLCRALRANRSVGLLSLKEISALEQRPDSPTPVEENASALQKSRESLKRRSVAPGGARDRGGKGEEAPQEDDEASLLLQMLERAVGFNVQFKELRRHASVFDLPVGASLMSETLASWLEGDSYLQKKLLLHLQHVRRLHQRESGTATTTGRVRRHGRQLTASSAVSSSMRLPSDGLHGDKWGQGTPSGEQAEAASPPVTGTTASWAPGGSERGRNAPKRDGRARSSALGSVGFGAESETKGSGDEGAGGEKIESWNFGRFRAPDQGEERRDAEGENRRVCERANECEGSEKQVEGGRREFRVRFCSGGDGAEEPPRGEPSVASYDAAQKDRAAATACDDEDRFYIELENALADKMLTADGSSLKSSLFPAFKEADLKELEGILNVKPRWQTLQGRQGDKGEDMR
ncbi:hypothetical protein BESB_066010 [Besnoitia besnoiti]|uniref:Leucine rich repeat protein n=1 Tax=Besnoitia besnoiti TaxID=94643 RepID=A0A2A9M7V5_BESBE|nr:hypothetical protein BESB_066010 [Besnoitia besnoiti]PFH34568.1 hypothetical protein BESB_066010 [Besnoitia besnoiti]